MRTSNRFAAIAALLSVPLLAMAAPTSTPGGDTSRESQEQKMGCKKSCDCHAKANEAKSSASSKGLDFFRATDFNATP